MFSFFNKLLNRSEKKEECKLPSTPEIISVVPVQPPGRASKTGDKGLELIKHYEKLKLVAYMPTPNDVPTIGWGTTRINGQPVKLGTKITKEQADQYFQEDLLAFEKAINSLVKVDLTQYEFDAVISLVYNIGTSAFKTSTLLKLLNTGDKIGASKQFERWVRQKGVVLNGLVKRRKTEKTLFLFDRLSF